jgi:hypothetical protein
MCVKASVALIKRLRKPGLPSRARSLQRARGALQARPSEQDCVMQYVGRTRYENTGVDPR